MKYDFLTIGGATEDIVFYTSEGILINNFKKTGADLLAFRHGSKIKVDKSFSFFGGGSANAAVNFANLGFKTASIFAVGDDYRGKEIIDNLKNKKIATNLVKKIKNKESSFSIFAIDKSGEYIAFIDRGAKTQLLLNNKDIDVIKKTKWIYLTSMSGAWEKNLDKIFANKKNLAWNPGKIQLEAGFSRLKKYLKNTDVLMVNRLEATQLVSSVPKYKNKRFLSTAKNLVKIIKELGPQKVIVTNSQKGAEYYDGDLYIHQGILPGQKRVDTTGVGDCFNSSFTAGLELYDNDIKKALQLGVLNAKSVVGARGAQNGLIKLKDIKI